jgi:F-type H+-transporting ATPase subunit epsilon
MSFQCTIVTPESQALDETVSQVILPAFDGLVGVLTDRAPMLVKLAIGPLRVDLAGGSQKYFLIDGGVAQMKSNKLTVLATSAVPASNLEAETARVEYAEALARVPTDAKTAAVRQKQMEHARAAMALAGKA